MKLCSININTWESCAEDRLAWCLAVREGVQKAEEAKNTTLAQKRAKRKERQRQLRQYITFHMQQMQQRLPLACRAVQPLVKVQIDITTWMLHCRLSKTEGCRRRRQPNPVNVIVLPVQPFHPLPFSLLFLLLFAHFHLPQAFRGQCTYLKTLQWPHYRRGFHSKRVKGILVDCYCRDMVVELEVERKQPQ